MRENQEEYYERKINMINGFMKWFPRIWLLIFSSLIFLFVLISETEKAGGNFQSLIKISPTLVPWLLLFVLVYVSWRWEKLGGFILILVSIIATIFFGFYKNPAGFAFVIFPVLLPGILLLANSYQNRKEE